MTALPDAGRLGARAPLRLGMMPPPADCLNARAGTGLSPHTLAPGTTVVLTSPDPPGNMAAEWSLGTGKTQLAAYLAESLWRSPGLALMVWADAAARSSVLASYAHAFAEISGAPAEDAETASSRLVAWLAEASEPWLLVLDDLTSPADLAGLLPRGPAGRVLVTARPGASLPGEPAAVDWPVGAFSAHEALAYVLARLPSDPDQRAGAVDLIEDLGCHPLALAQATAIVASSDLTCRDYHKHLARRMDEVSQPGRAKPAPAAATWTLSLEYADQLRPEGLAQPCLALAALLDGKGIPCTVFGTQAAREYLAAHGSANPSGPEPSHGLASLQRAGLVSVDPAHPGPVARLSAQVKDAALAAMPDEMRYWAGTAAAHALRQAWPADDQPPQLAQAFRSGAASLLHAAPDALFADGYHPVLLRAAQSLAAARLTGASVDYWQDIAVTGGRLLGPSHPGTLKACGMLGRAVLAAGRPGEAIGLCEQVLGLYTGTHGPDHPGAVATRADLGQALLAAGRPGDAVAALEDVARAHDRGQRADDLDSLRARCSLADAYRAAGRIKDAIALYERVLASRERLQAPGQPDTMTIRASLAHCYCEAGRLKAALPQYRRSLSDRERVLGAAHPDTTAARASLASAYHSARRLREAIPLYERVLEDRGRLQGANHPETIAARGNLASAYHSAGRLAAAIQLYEQTLACCQQTLGPDHQDTLASRANLAQAYYTAGRLTQAVSLLRDVAGVCERVLPAGHPLTRTVREALQAMTDD
jgi:tetratricopeptide (TPR) repeat protein